MGRTVAASQPDRQARRIRSAPVLSIRRYHTHTIRRSRIARHRIHQTQFLTNRATTRILSSPSKQFAVGQSRLNLPKLRANIHNGQQNNILQTTPQRFSKARKYAFRRLRLWKTRAERADETKRLLLQHIQSSFPNANIVRSIVDIFGGERS
ncbi:hypothetical protein BJ508DRAFT_47734 [Ascobolus immersus RN42]|uniref:Uncharacterized protein n=1 Tax=Ascobolus immersus RN42 TaxID=1160509 RepID=A0A3N4IER7_ASCIM|nr:hypothetical protein BJ508DRAFT_47734 [Ascobolus immersus RN42]